MKLELEEVKVVDSVKGKGVNMLLQLTRDAAEIAAALHKQGICASAQGTTLVLQPDYQIGEQDIMTLKKALNEL